MFFDNIFLRGLVHFARLRTLPMAGLSQLWGGRGEGWNGRLANFLLERGPIKTNSGMVGLSPCSLNFFGGGPVACRTSLTPCGWPGVSSNSTTIRNQLASMTPNADRIARAAPMGPLLAMAAAMHPVIHMRPVSQPGSAHSPTLTMDRTWGLEPTGKKKHRAPTSRLKHNVS